MPLPPTPEPPDWSIDWGSIDSLPWIQSMKGCPQNPDRHAEGDVWTHVHMVLEEMARLPQWREQSSEIRQLLFRGALLHDVSKAACTRREADGRISSRGHAWRGAIRARSILWKLSYPFAEREKICSIVRHHLVPFFCSGSEDPKRIVAEVSQTIRPDWLSIMATADAKGRICPDPQKLIDQIAAFRQQAESMGCLDRPASFESDHHRIRYFRQLPEPQRAQRSRVTVLSGLPAAGKDHWIEQNVNGQAVISLDEIRADLKIAPHEPQAEVLNRAGEIALGHLREGRDFVWNSTNLSRHLRNECLRLLLDHDAHVRIVYVEVPAETLFNQNRNRKRKLPEKVIEKLLDRWEVPDLTEGHEVEYLVSRL